MVAYKRPIFVRISLSRPREASSKSMRPFTGLWALCALAGLATAWLPGEHRDIESIDGQNLFNRTVPSSSATDKRWLPASGKIRGVDLGTLFVFEPWIAESAWSDMGCGGQQSEFDCVSHLGQSAANSAFQSHWSSWITKDDITQMQSYGLNTIRIPVGYWLREDIVYSDSEHFPQGGLSYLGQVCGWAADAGFYIIIDLHGAPGAQVAKNADTGQVGVVMSPRKICLMLTTQPVCPDRRLLRGLSV